MPQEYIWVPANCLERLKKLGDQKWGGGGVTCDELAFWGAGRGSNIIPSHLMLGKPRVRDKLLIRMKKVLARPTKRLCEYLFAVKS